MRPSVSKLRRAGAFDVTLARGRGVCRVQWWRDDGPGDSQPSYVAIFSAVDDRTVGAGSLEDLRAVVRHVLRGPCLSPSLVLNLDVKSGRRSWMKRYACAKCGASECFMGDDCDGVPF